ncbi:MAG: hypothetical protein WKG07_38485 [Hymenobacter sp.]
MKTNYTPRRGRVAVCLLLGLWLLAGPVRPSAAGAGWAWPKATTAAPTAPTSTPAPGRLAPERLPEPGWSRPQLFQHLPPAEPAAQALGKGFFHQEGIPSRSRRVAAGRSTSVPPPRCAYS